MLQSTTHRRLARTLWCLVVLDLLALWPFGNLRPTTQAELMLMMLIAVCWLVFTALLGISLALCYHRAWGGWRAWLLLLGLMIGSGAALQSPAHIGSLDLQALATLTFLGTWAALITAIGIWLYRRDVGGALLAWFSLAAVWALLLVWVLRGDFLTEMLASQPTMLASMITTISSSLGFGLGVLMVSAICLLPLAVLSAVWHSLRLIRRELGRATLPPPPDDEQ